MKKLILTSVALACFSMGANARTPATADVTLCVDNAGSDSNSGIAPACKQTICAAAKTLYRDWDMRHFDAFVQVTGGQVFDESCYLGSQLTGTNLLQIVNSSTTNPFKWENNNTCLQFGDNAEVRVGGPVTYVCNKNNLLGQAAVVVHNNGIFDLDGPAIFSGGGLNDNAILCDGPCIFTVKDGMQIQGQFDSVVWGGRHMAGTFSGPVVFNGAFINQFFTLRSGSTITLGGVASGAAWSSIGGGLASAGPSLVTGNSVLNANGLSIPGGVATGTGGQVCTSTC